MARITKLEMFASILEVVARRSSCLKPNAALIVKDGRIISMGYNGAPSGLPHCLEEGCLPDRDGGCIRTIHAEQNAIAFAAKSGISTDGADLYSTSSPCLACAKLIINSGIKKVLFTKVYRESAGVDLLVQAKIGIGPLP